MFRHTGAVVLFLFAVGVLSAAPSPEDCRKHEHFGRKAEARQCFESLAASQNHYLRAEGLWGLRNFKGANDEFRLAVSQYSNNPDIRVRWGRFYEERYQKADAEALFREALEINPKHAGAMLGLALVASDGYESKAVEYAQKAIEQDPKLVEAQELLARLALEDSNPAKASTEADKAIAMTPDALEALSIRATIEFLNDKPGTEWVDRVLKINPSYGGLYATAGHFFILNRRYEEGIKYYRKALELDPNLDGIRSQLGVNLMRLGEEQEARTQLEKAYDNGYKDALTTNSLKLLDSYKNFVTYKTNNTILKLDKKEAELLRPYMEGELKRSIATYEKKYKMKLNRPVQLEVYPNHEDFAVRTLGMPGLGALGVTFGYVVAMDSPSGRPPGTFHWDSTLWHEMSHVFVLAATNHKVPRWFTEGLAVHEETAASPDWGDRLDMGAINAIRNHKLLPVAELDRGFIRPSYPSQVIVSYFQAGRICDYISLTWSYDKLLDMMHDFAKAKTTPEVIRKNLGLEPEEFDKKFLAWLEAQTKNTVTHIDDWKKRMKALNEAAKAGKNDEVLKLGAAARDFYPEYVEAGNAYELMADAYLANGDTPSALKQLERYSEIGGRDPTLLKKLAGMQEASGKKTEAAQTLQRINFIYPIDEELHHKLGDLWMAGGYLPGAIMEYQAAVALKPLDQAASRFNLARALRGANRIDDAKEQLLLALEAAPGYKPAQKLLLEISR